MYYLSRFLHGCVIVLIILSFLIEIIVEYYVDTSLLEGEYLRSSRMKVFKKVFLKKRLNKYLILKLILYYNKLH